MPHAVRLILLATLLVSFMLSDSPARNWGAMAAQGQSTPFGKHPRLFLTAAKKAELMARMKANTADYQSFKTATDSLVMNKPWLVVNAELAVPIATGDTSITVKDASPFPTGAFQIRINLELINIASRSGNVLTVAANGRGTTTNVGWPTVAAKHARGATVWQHVDGLSHIEAPTMLALFVQLGVPGYELQARGAMSVLMMYASTFAGSTNLDQIRYYWANVALTYDWLYDHLTADDKAIYAEAMRWTTDYHLHSPNVPKEWFTLQIGRQSAIEAALFANIGNGQLRSELMLAAASYGDNPEALSQWNEAKAKVDRYLVPAVTTGGAAQGVSLEGSEYAESSWTQTLDIFYVIASAIGDESYLATVVDVFAPFAARHIFYATMPGSTNSLESTVGTIAAGSRTMRIADASSWTAGMSVRYAFDTPTPSPNSIAAHETYITAVSGNLLTLADPSPGTATDKSITHQIQMIAWGDAVQNDTNRYIDTAGREQFYEMMYHLLDRARNSNPTLASQIKFWIDNNARTNTTGQTRRMRFMWHDPAVVALDYRLTLPTIFASGNPTSTGLMVARSNWTATPTMIYFLVNGERFDHTHSDQNSYGIWRKGVWLSREIPGYAVDPYPGPWFQSGTNGVELGKYRGPRYHNTLLMNLHGGVNGNSGVLSTGPSAFARQEVGTDYVYGRGDASGVYASDAATSWTDTGFPSDVAQTFIRDFLYIKPDLVAFADRLVYGAPSASPTMWIAQFPENPTVAQQRITLSYSGQKIVQDIVVPAGAKLTTIDQLAEYPPSRVGSLSLKIPQSLWRVETTSGTTTSNEWGLQIIQTMDDGVAPETVTRLTTTTANVAQVGRSYVIGTVKGAAAGLNISYSYAGSPTHYLMGFEPRTNYQVVDTGGTITITAASGSGNRMSSAAGLLIFRRPTGATSESPANPPPAPTSLIIKR